jgi:hypothetical protein
MRGVSPGPPGASLARSWPDAVVDELPFDPAIRAACDATTPSQGLTINTIVFHSQRWFSAQCFPGLLFADTATSRLS